MIAMIFFINKNQAFNKNWGKNYAKSNVQK